MPTYITLVHWTQKGIENVKESPARYDQFKEAVRTAGGEVKSCYLTLGTYDLVTVIEVPDDETYARLALAVSARGSVRPMELRYGFPTVHSVS